MKNNFLITFLLLIQFSVQGNERDSIVVTYIANCGFMIEMDSTKIIIDGLFTDGFNFYATPDSATLGLITKGLVPFDNIDYVFVTHKHLDHFDARTVNDFMINNTKSILICPKHVTGELKKYQDDYKRFESRIIECTPDPNYSINLQLDKVEIVACRLAHGKENIDFENSAYIITHNSKTVFHTGDAAPDLIDSYLGIIPSEKNIDVAFINSGFGNFKNFEITNRFIAAKIYIAMHFPKDFFKMERKAIMDVPDSFKEPIVFKGSMERRVFYLNQQ